MAGKLRELPEVMPADARRSAVLQLLFPVEKEIRIVLIRRVEDGHAHSGQISFPGGRWEPEDGSLQRTALREAEEEIGVSVQAPEVLGALTPIYIPVSGFVVHPFTAWLDRRPQYLPSPDEVSGIIEVPLSYLFDEGHKTLTQVPIAALNGAMLEVPAYKLAAGEIVWGATAMMLSELEAVWKQGR